MRTRKNSLSGHRQGGQPVNGGWIKHEARSGRFMPVGTDKGESRASRITETTVKAASARQSEALKRLADR